MSRSLTANEKKVLIEVSLDHPELRRPVLAALEGGGFSRKPFVTDLNEAFIRKVEAEVLNKFKDQKLAFLIGRFYRVTNTILAQEWHAIQDLKQEMLQGRAEVGREKESLRQQGMGVFKRRSLTAPELNRLKKDYQRKYRGIEDQTDERIDRIRQLSRRVHPDFTKAESFAEGLQTRKQSKGKPQYPHRGEWKAFG